MFAEPFLTRFAIFSVVKPGTIRFDKIIRYRYCLIPRMRRNALATDVPRWQVNPRGDARGHKKRERRFKCLREEH